MSEVVTIFVFPFAGFPGISWNVGAESKYLKVVKIGLSNKLDHPSTTKRGLPLVHQAEKWVSLWKVLVCKGSQLLNIW